MPFLLAEILDFQGSAHLIGVGSLSYLFLSKNAIIQDFSYIMAFFNISVKIT